MQLFNLHMLIRYEVEVDSSHFFHTYYNHTHIHSRPLEGRSQQLPFDWQQRMIHFKHFEARQRSCFQYASAGTILAYTTKK